MRHKTIPPADSVHNIQRSPRENREPATLVQLQQSYYFCAMITIPTTLVRIFTLCSTLFFTCAMQQAPGGGPDDKTSPTVVTTIPAAESVTVPRRTKIIITFSEWIAPASKKGITIFPPLPVKIEVVANRLIIKPVGMLNEATTYHIGITTTLQDLHTNPISSPVSLMFSTGPSLDSGSLAGCIVEQTVQFTQPKVALFRSPWAVGDSGFMGQPAYLTQTDSSRQFTFSHIGIGTYRLVAYVDKNNDGHIQPLTEEVYSTVDTCITVKKTTPRVMLYTSAFDTTQQHIESVKAITNHRLSVSWKKPYDASTYTTQPPCKLIRTDSLGSTISLSYVAHLEPTRFSLITKEALTVAPYQLIVTLTSRTNPLHSSSDTVRFNGTSVPDTVPPVFARSIPLGTTDLLPDMKLCWSEPVLITDTLMLTDTLGDTVPVVCKQLFADTSQLEVTRSLLSGRRYRLILLSNSGKDMANNLLKTRDSTDTVAIVTIATTATDSIATSLQGGSPCLDTNNSSLRRWIFKPFTNFRSFICKDAAGTFRFDSLPATKGQLGYFIDSNHNNQPDHGNLKPFIAPEPFYMFPDTVEARARWDIEDVTLTPCDPCFQRVQPSKTDSSLTKQQ